MTKTSRKKKRFLQTITNGLKRAPRWILSTPRLLFSKRRNHISNTIESNERYLSRSLRDEEQHSSLSLNAVNGYTVEHEDPQNMIGQDREINMNRIEAQIMNDVERTLRAIVILSTVYLMGVYYPGGTQIIERIVKVVLIAWCTILFIQFLTFISSFYVSNRIRNGATTITDNGLPEQEPLLRSKIKEYHGLEGKEIIPSEERNEMKMEDERNETTPKKDSPLHKKKSLDINAIDDTLGVNPSIDMDDELDLGIETMHSDVGAVSMDVSSPVFPPQNHPDLEDVFVINDYNHERATCNDDKIELETEYIKGFAWFSVRTKDADLKIAPSISGGTPQNDKVSNYFRKKQRRFELQMQFKFKKVPDSNLFIGFFIEEQIQLGMVQRAFVNAALGFLQKKLKGSLHCNTTGDSRKEEGQLSDHLEQPHFSISLLQTLDRFVVSPEGVVPPQLGTEIHEDTDSIKRRKTTGFSIEFNCKDTYTMCIWSAYVDFVKWKVVNLPMVRPFSIASVIGDQPLSVIIYSLKSEANNTETIHSKANMNQLLNYQVSNTKCCAVSGARKRFIEKCMIPPQQNGTVLYRNEVSDDEVSVDDEYSSDELDDTTVAVVEDLGEGIYVHSGDSVVLREPSDEEYRYSTLTNSGGYATLASFSSTTVVLEKVKIPQDCQHYESNLIRNGDTVLIKSLSDESTPPSYLSVYKGCWLKWTTRVPRSSGFFLVNTIAPESKHGAQIDAHSLYLRLGGEFSLTSKSFGLKVGIQRYDSAAFGGRLLGLRSKSKSDTNDKRTLAPLLLCADEQGTPSLSLKSSSPQKSLSPHQYSEEEKDLFQYEVDVPAWIEMLHRSKRSLQRIYVIRATGNASKSFVKLRTGKELTPLIRLGISFESNQGIYSNEINQTNSIDDPMFTFDHSTSYMSQPGTFDEECINSDSSSFDVEEENEEELEEEDEEDNYEEYAHNACTSYKESKSHGWIKSTASGLSKVAKGVKSGTITVGKAFKQRRHTTRHLPRTPGQGKRSIHKDHHIAVNKMLKSSRHVSSNVMSNALAGQLNAGCETCRTVNNIVSGLKVSNQSDENSNILSDMLSIDTELDSAFLTGGLVELGVDPKDIHHTAIIGEYVVAKASWQSFWKEQALVVDSKALNFFNPLSTNSSLIVPFCDVRNIRQLDEYTLSACPLVSFPLLAIETASIIHYIAFHNKEIRQECYDTLVKCLTPFHQSISEKDDANSFWQGFQAHSENKWAKIYSKNKKKSRIVLNSRKIAFDCPSFESVEQCEAHVQELLSRLLSFESLEFVQPNQFVEFLDLASGLKNLPLKRLNKSEASTLCICVNIYHVLLLHALLLFGMPSKKHLVTFMRTYCYEIGGDVFSLAELDSCVIVGKYARPYKSPFPVAPRRSITAYPKLYALDYIDARLHFVICRRLRDVLTIPILDSDTLEETLVEQSQKYLAKHFMIDTEKRIITLPKMCSIFRNDFGSDQRSCVIKLLEFMEPELQTLISNMLEDGNYTVIKYESSIY